MSDSRCLVCRGAGFVTDRQGRDEPCACKNFVPRQGDNQSLADILAVSMRRAAEAEAAIDVHRQSCDVRPCGRCERFVCRCGAPFDGARQDGSCDACRGAAQVAKAMAKVQDAIPKRFGWIFAPDGVPVADRVRLPADTVRRAIANPPAGDMVLIGDTGAGKTTLAIAMLASWVRRDPASRTGPRFAESWKLAGAAARHPLGQGEAPEIREAKRAPLLIVDDLGSEMDDKRGVLAEVIFSRHNDELPTWITTGFDAEYLVSRYGSQVIRRLLEHGKRVQLGGGK